MPVPDSHSMPLAKSPLNTLGLYLYKTAPHNHRTRFLVGRFLRQGNLPQATPSPFLLPAALNKKSAVAGLPCAQQANKCGKHSRSTAIHTLSHDLALLAPQRALVHTLAGTSEIYTASWSAGTLPPKHHARQRLPFRKNNPRSALGLRQRAPVAGLHARAAGRVPVIPVPVRVVVVAILALARHTHAGHPGVHQPGAHHTACGSEQLFIWLQQTLAGLA